MSEDEPKVAALRTRRTGSLERLDATAEGREDAVWPLHRSPYR